MSKKALRIVNLIVALLVCVFALGHAFAWLAGDRKDQKLTFDGSSGQAYFASGNGEKGTPYEITNQFHLYNLAWLQDTGKLNAQKYYFKLGADFTVPENLWLPPIGTDEFPFVGEFDGKGHTITNLKITTDKSKLGVDNSRVSFSNAVGMFGKTAVATTGVDTNGVGAEIKNFILEKPKVEVADTNTYAAGSNRAAGIAIGHVAEKCKAASIGVLADTAANKAELLMRRTGYSTFNSIIGELAKNVESSVTGGGHLSGSGGDISIFNPSQFFSEKVFETAQTNNFMSSSGLTASTWLVSVKGKTKTDENNNVINEDSSDYLGIGNFAFINESTTSFDTSSAASISDNTYVMYKSVTYNQNDAKGNVTDHNKVILNSDSEYSKNFVDTHGNQISALDHCLYMENSPKYTSDKTSNIKVVDEANNVLSGSASYCVPLNVIMVNIVDTTKARLLVVAGGHKNSRSIAIKCLVEQNTTNKLSEFNFYNGFSRFAATKNDLKVNYSSDEIKKYPGFELPLAGTELTAYEVDLRGRGEGIYALYSTNGGIDIFYLAVVGVEGGNAGSENGAVDESKAVSAVDFIYRVDDNKVVEIAQEKKTDANGNEIAIGNFVVNTSGTTYEMYVATGTSIYFDNLNKALEIAYIRPRGGKDSSNKTLTVTVSPAADKDLVKQTQTTALIQGAS